MNELELRTATPADAPRLAEIYNHYILHSTATFEVSPVTDEEMARRIVDISASFPYFVALLQGAHRWVLLRPRLEHACRMPGTFAGDHCLCGPRGCAPRCRIRADAPFGQPLPPGWLPGTYRKHYRPQPPKYGHARETRFPDGGALPRGGRKDGAGPGNHCLRTDDMTVENEFRYLSRLWRCG